jgi:hypothetical protein
LGLAVAGLAQWNKKPYTEWSEKEALKLLNDSPWGQTQVISDVSRMGATGPGGNTRASQTEDSSSRHINFRIRFLSAKPIRQAFSRMIEIKQQGELDDQLAARLKAFSTQDFPDYIIVTVDVDSTATRGELQQARVALGNRTTGELQNNTFLQVKEQRVFLQEYQPPKNDGLGARFIFPRLVDGKPFITPESSEVRFASELTAAYKLNMRYKVKDMMFDGKLEY